MLARGLRQSGQRRLKGQVFTPPGVDAAEQRVDQTVDQFLAEPATHFARHRFIALAAGARQAEVLPRPGDTVRGQNPGRGQFAKVGRYAHELAPRQRTDAPPRPDPGCGRAWQLQFPGQPELADQTGALRPPGEQSLGAGVDPDSGYLGNG